MPERSKLREKLAPAVAWRGNDFTILPSVPKSLTDPDPVDCGVNSNRNRPPSLVTLRWLDNGASRPDDWIEVATVSVQECFMRAKPDWLLTVNTMFAPVPLLVVMLYQSPSRSPGQ